MTQKQFLWYTVKEIIPLNPGDNLEPSWYRASTAEGFSVLAQYWQKHALPPARLRKVTWLKVVHRYWRGTGHRYQASTEICSGSVLALLWSRLLADTWSQDSGCTMPVPGQPSTRSQLSSTGIAPCLQLVQYCAVCKYWHESDFSTWELKEVLLIQKKFLYWNKSTSLDQWKFFWINKTFFSWKKFLFWFEETVFSVKDSKNDFKS